MNTEGIHEMNKKNPSIQNYQHIGKIKHILVSTVYNLQG